MQLVSSASPMSPGMAVVRTYAPGNRLARHTCGTWFNLATPSAVTRVGRGLAAIRWILGGGSRRPAASRPPLPAVAETPRFLRGAHLLSGVWPRSEPFPARFLPPTWGEGGRAAGSLATRCGRFVFTWPQPTGGMWRCRSRKGNGAFVFGSIQETSVARSNGWLDKDLARTHGV